MPAVGRKWLASMAVWLVMAALCGLIGFLIIVHYATSERPSEQFAIVVDAGSTQTRSSLYHITVHVPELADWTRRVSDEFAAFQDEHDTTSAWELEAAAADATSPSGHFKFPLSNLIQVRQVSSCTNGGPLAAIASAREARDLLSACLRKFGQHIKLLDFVGATGGELRVGEEQQLPEADELSRRLALAEHRINSVTHLYLGATAGMRALERLNATRAREKLRWMDEAIGSANELLLPPASPYINRGFVGTIAGSDEASFGWISVNFVCDTLYVHAPLAGLQLSGGATANKSELEAPPPPPPPPVAYQLGERQPAERRQLIARAPHSIGTLELGGASAQMAFQAAPGALGSGQIARARLEEQQLDLFNGHYRMATRSDLCLGMSQAVLRLNYVALYRAFGGNATSNNKAREIKLENPCLQRGARLRASGLELAKLWQGTCLAPATNLDSLDAAQAQFRRDMTAAERASIEWIGTGEANKCNALLDELIQPARCKRFFALCPANTNLAAPPRHMPFVTISGFNHALNVLHLEQAPATGADADVAAGEWPALNQAIRDKLGGNSIDYSEFVAKTGEFCATDASELPRKYPRVNEKFRDVICLQLVYIRKLLVEFYRFEPATSWPQIKFLIFAPNSVPSQFAALKKTAGSPEVKQIRLDARRDIGWTLGLLLNATSYQLGAGEPVNEVHFHHGATVMYIIRATILLMLACFLIALALLVAGVVEVRQAQSRAEAYISHSTTPSEASSSSYDVSHLAPTPSRQPTKPTALKYVLSD